MRYFRVCASYHDFLDRVFLLTRNPSGYAVVITSNVSRSTQYVYHK